MSGSALLRARGVTRWYGRGSALVRAVDEVDLEVPAGQTLAVMGPSGCGKSTLLHLLGGLQRPTDGEIWLAGHRIDTMSERALARLRRQHIGFVFQSFHLMDELTAVENVELAALLAGQSPAGPVGAPWTCSTGSGSPTAPGTCRRRCPAASASGSPSPAR